MLSNGLHIGAVPHSMAQVKLITTLPQTTALGLPHGWELVNQVGVVALFAGKSSQWASYFGVPVVLLIMSFRAYAQVLPTVKLRGIIPRSKLATEKNLGKNSTQCSKTRSILLRIAIIACFWNGNNHSASTHEIGIEIWALGQKIFSPQFPRPSPKFWKIADFKSAISPLLELQMRWFFFWNCVFLNEKFRYAICFF